jgi:hypothetical protein
MPVGLFALEGSLPRSNACSDETKRLFLLVRKDYFARTRTGLLQFVMTEQMPWRWLSTVVLMLMMRRWAGGFAIVRFHLPPSSRGLAKGKLNEASVTHLSS